MPYQYAVEGPGRIDFVRPDGTVFTAPDGPAAREIFATLPRRQEQSAPLADSGAGGAPSALAGPAMTGGGGGATGGVQTASYDRPRNVVAPVVADVQPDMRSGGAVGASGGYTPPTAAPAAAPAASEKKPSNVDPKDLADNTGDGGGGGAAGGGSRRDDFHEMGDRAREEQIRAEMRGGGPARLVKGGTNQTGMTTKQIVDGGKPEERITAMNDANTTAAFAGKDVADADAKFAGEMNANMAAYRAAEAGKDEALADWKNETLGKMTEDRERLEREAGEMKIDPANFWADKTTGEKIAFFLASAISGGLNGRAGIQGNQVLDAVNKRIDADIAAQVRNLETKKGRITEIGRVYQQALDRFGNLEVARNTAKARSLMEAEKLAATQAAGSRDEAVRARADQFLADLAAQRERLWFDNTGKVTNEVDRTFKTTQDRVVGGGGPNWRKIEEISDRGVKANETKKDGGPQTAVFLGQRYDLGHMEPTEAAKARESLATVNNFKEDVAYLRKLRSSTMERVMPSVDQKAVQNRIGAAMSNMQKMGVLMGNEREEYQQILSNFRSGDEALANMEAFGMRAGNQIVTQAGGRPLDASPQPTAPARRK